LSIGLPNAVEVLDTFHVVRLGLAAVDDVRCRVQQQHWSRALAAMIRCTASGGCCPAASTA
jgi:transposase